MKKNKLLLIMTIILATITLSGCTQNLTDKDKKVVTNSETGQRVIKNILCQPENELTISLYQENDIDLSQLPKCDEFSITSGGYEGIWTTIFVKPLAWIILFIGKMLKSYGLAVILTTLLIRAAMYPLTNKTALQSENMKKAQPELNKLEKKYRGNMTQEMQMQKTQEMMMIYKKYNISPFAGCIFALIQIPLFFAFYEALNRLPAIFESNFLGFQLGTSPLTAFGQGKYYYIIFIILIIATTFYSFKLNSTATLDGNQANQMKMMTRISTICISIASFTISTGIGLYWIFNSGFTIIQNILVKRRKKNDNII